MNDSLELHEAELIRRNGTYYVLNDGHEYICTFPMDVNNISEGKLAEFVIHRNRAVGLRVKPKPEPIRYGTIILHHDGPRVQHESAVVPFDIDNKNSNLVMGNIGSEVKFKVKYESKWGPVVEVLEIIDKAYVIKESELRKMMVYASNTSQHTAESVWNEVKDTWRHIL